MSSLEKRAERFIANKEYHKNPDNKRKDIICSRCGNVKFLLRNKGWKCSKCGYFFKEEVVDIHVECVEHLTLFGKLKKIFV